MRIDVRIKKVGYKKRTTEYEILGKLHGKSPHFFVNTEKVSSLPFDTTEMILSMASQPFADGEVAAAFPPVPFSHASDDVVRYRHMIERKGRRKPRQAPNTPELGVTLVYIKRSNLDDDFVAGQGSIYFGLSPAPEAVSSDRTQAAADVGAVDEGVRAAILEAIDVFVMRRFRPQRGAWVTSRDIRDEFIEEEGHNFSEDELNNLRPIDITRRVRAIFGVTMVATPTRIKGRHQRYWDGYTI